MNVNWKTLRPALIATGHLLGALVIAYAFIVVLITASLQARVADSLAKQPSGAIEYSNGYSQWRQSLRLDRKLELLGEAEQDAARFRNTARDKREDLSDAYLVLEAPFKTLVERLNATGCAIDLGRSNPEELSRAIAQARACASERPLTPALKRDIDTILATSNQLLKADTDWLSKWREHDRYEKGLVVASARIRETEKLLLPLKPSREAFEPMSALQQRWMVAGAMLTELPPSVTQIVLAFVAGMFGALLLILVLIVYPKSNFRLTSRNGDYPARILLGGLISVCVFVVLGGGTAVLGTTTAFTEGDANFMALCAIGILAGMFSDRVAAWLSARASTFFSSNPAGGGGTATTTTPTGPTTPATTTPAKPAPVVTKGSG